MYEIKIRINPGFTTCFNDEKREVCRFLKRKGDESCPIWYCALFDALLKSIDHELKVERCTECVLKSRRIKEIKRDENKYITIKRK